MIFADLEKAYDRVPRDIVGWALRKTTVGEECIKVIPDMYDAYNISENATMGSTESFEVKVGPHQGSALSPLLFITVMDVISQEVGRGPPNAMLFADDLETLANKQKSSWNCEERQSRIRDCVTASQQEQDIISTTVFLSWQ